MNGYMNSPIIQVTLERENLGEPWGFRLQGGSDFKLALSVKKITPSTPAQSRLHIGDVIIGIDGHDVQNWTHQKASDAIKNANYTLKLMIRKGQYSLIKPAKAPVILTSPIQNTLKQF